MAPPKGNNYWKLRWQHGRKHKIETPEQILKMFFEYMEHIETNPLFENKVGFHQGEGFDHHAPVMRCGTWEGFAVYMGISRITLNSYRDRGEDFLSVLQWCEDALRERKIEGAAAGLLNANIVARDLGLRDQRDIDHTTAGKPIARMEIEYVEP